MKVFQSILLCVFLIAAFPLAVIADENQQYVKNELASEITQCWAYYAFAGKCASNGDTPEEKQVASASAKLVEKLTGWIYDASKEAGMKDEAIQARMKLYLDNIKGDISNSCVNLSIIIGKYATSCKALVEHPESRAQELLKGNR